jgi:hypothetical protein
MGVEYHRANRAPAKETAMEDRINWGELFSFMAEGKAMARALLRHERQVSLQTTALVLSALRRQRLAEQDWSSVTWPNRRYFFGVLYRAMERALLDHACVDLPLTVRPAPQLPPP